MTVFRATYSWPKSELYGLTAQLKRAALSAPTNIVEGSARLGSREFRRFLGFSLASLAEVGYLLRVAKELEILRSADWEDLNSQREKASKLTWLLLKSLRTDTRSSPDS
jgi:four helix bundle protein